jgi:hypothetical protein
MKNIRATDCIDRRAKMCLRLRVLVLNVYCHSILEFHVNRCYKILTFVILDKDISLYLCDSLSENYLRNKITVIFKIILNFVE